MFLSILLQIAQLYGIAGDFSRCIHAWSGFDVRLYVSFIGFFCYLSALQRETGQPFPLSSGVKYLEILE